MILISCVLLILSSLKSSSLSSLDLFGVFILFYARLCYYYFSLFVRRWGMGPGLGHMFWSKGSSRAEIPAFIDLLEGRASFLRLLLLMIILLLPFFPPSSPSTSTSMDYYGGGGDVRDKPTRIHIQHPYEHTHTQLCSSLTRNSRLDPWISTWKYIRICTNQQTDKAKNKVHDESDTQYSTIVSLSLSFQTK